MKTVACVVGLLGSMAFGALLNDGTDRPRYVLVADPVKIFGQELLGWGVDLRIGKPEDSLRVPYYTMTWTDGLRYTYPLEPATAFLLPDDVYSRTVNQIVSTQKRYESWDTFLSSLQLELGLGLTASKADNGSPEAASNDQGSGGVPSMSTFSGDVSFQYSRRLMTRQDTLKLVSTMEVGLYQLFLGPTIPPRGRVTERVEQARSQALLGEKWAYATFIAQHGTHFIEAVTVGGYLEMQSDVYVWSSNETAGMSVKANFMMKNMLGLDEARIDLDISTLEDIKQFESSTTHNMKAMGGDVQLADFFSNTTYKKTGKTFEDWQRSLIRNAVPIRYRLRESCWLFDEDREACHEELIKYLNGETPF